MRLIKFKALGVHGYLDFNVSFREDVNFFSGLNGCGKTTALNMIMAMLTPSISKLFEMSFSSASLSVEKSNETFYINFDKFDDELTISFEDNHRVIAIEKFLFNPNSNNDEDFFVNRGSSELVRGISKLTPPMFLSLDRRFVKSSRDFDLSMNYDVLTQALRKVKLNQTDSSLQEIIDIVSEVSSEAKSRQSSADNKLRNDIILDSLSFSETTNEAHIPNNETLQELRNKQVAIKKTFDNLDVPSEEFELKYNLFFDKLEDLARKVELLDSSKNEAGINDFSKYLHEAISEWYVNQHQLKRIDSLFSKVESYQNEKSKIYARINKFEELVNKFLIETGKRVEITDKGKLVIKFAGKERELSVLSSGERQIVIMFVHLVLNKKLVKDGVFIIDEPELSLHLSWQDMFVDAIRKAGPNLQIILATHSPSIIGGRNHMYVPLNGKM